MLKLVSTIQRSGNFHILSFFNKIWVLRVKSFVLPFLVDILFLGSRSVDPQLFADPDSGSQNLANPTNPDPKN